MSLHTNRRSNDRCVDGAVQRMLLAAAFAAMVWLAPTDVAAQESEGPETNAPPVKSDEPTLPVPEDDGKGVRYLEGPDGKAVAVPKNATSEGYLEYVKRLSEATGPNAPQHSIASIELTGTADADWAVLDVAIEIQIVPEGQWVLVPLDLREAVLQKTSHAHEGGGEAIFDRFERERGHGWWIRGKGLHQLSLTVLLPIQKQPAGRRIQLTLPETKVSHLALKLPVPKDRLSFKVPENSTAKAHDLGKAESELEVWGLHRLLDVSWTALPTAGTTRLRLKANSAIAVGFTEESVVLKVSQTISADQGSFDHVDVRLPSGYSLRSLERDDSAEAGQYQPRSINPDDPSQVRVQFDELTRGPVMLRWVLETKFPEGTGEIVIDGLEVDRALQQQGRIGIEEVDGYQITKVEKGPRDASRVSISAINNIPEFRTLAGGSKFRTAYIFYEQPYQLALEVKEIEPYYTVEPLVHLQLSGTQATLTANFHFEVFNGAVQEVELPWPLESREGWRLARIEAKEVIDRTAGEGLAESDLIRVEFAKRQSSKFVVTLTAEREIDETAGPVVLRFPEAIASSATPPQLVVTKAENVEFQLTPTGKTSLQILPVSKTNPAIERAPGSVGYTIDSPEKTLSLQVTTHEQQVETSTTIEVDARSVPGRLIVKQHILYDVSYEGLTSVRLMIPNGLASPEPTDPQVLFLRDETEELVPVDTSVKTSAARQIRIDLDPPELGRIEIVAEYEIDAPEQTDDASFALSLITSNDTPFSESRLTLATSPRVSLIPDGSDWKKQLFRGQSVQWATAGEKTSVSLRFEGAEGPQSHDFTIVEAVVQVQIQPNGAQEGLSSYHIKGSPETMQVSFPAPTAPRSFSWNGKELEADAIQEIGSGSREYVLTLADVAETTSESSQVLLIEFHIEEQELLGWSRALELHSPQFDGVWIDRTIWRVSLPSGQYLFTQPVGVVPEFSWQRNLLFWSRSSHPEFEQLPGWLREMSTGTDLENRAATDAYVFSSFGPVEQLEFRSMSQSTIVLLGAGAALAVGFLLLKVPVTRNAMTLLIMMFAVSLISLWYSAPVKLLMQPALLGLILAVSAATIDRVARRKQRADILTLSAPSDLIGPASSVERGVVALVGSEDPTAVRPAGGAGPVEPISSSEAGSAHG
ncbi:MAG: hypothetical protein CMJ48_14110 [Planctomycetaceae bacterium]|nr:hypothetical protein [Planctomycetaceae bacterium]